MPPRAEEDLFLQFGCVGCPLCESDVDVDAGVTPIEALWMHEYACPAILLMAEAA